MQMFLKFKLENLLGHFFSQETIPRPEEWILWLRRTEADVSCRIWGFWSDLCSVSCWTEVVWLQSRFFRWRLVCLEHSIVSNLITWNFRACHLHPFVSPGEVGVFKISETDTVCRRLPASEACRSELCPTCRRLALTVQSLWEWGGCMIGSEFGLDQKRVATSSLHFSHHTDLHLISMNVWYLSQTLGILSVL